MAVAKKLDWNEVDPASLAPAVAKAYQGYKAAYATAKGIRAEFETACVKAAELPATHRLVFSYNFGKLSIAIDEAVPASKVGGKAIAFGKLKV